MVCFYSNAFSLLQNYAGPEPVECGLFSVVWKWRGPERMYCLLWTLSHEITNVECAR
jgi:hypothetical protein